MRLLAPSAPWEDPWARLPRCVGWKEEEKEEEEEEQKEEEEETEEEREEEAKTRVDKGKEAVATCLWKRAWP